MILTICQYVNRLVIDCQSVNKNFGECVMPEQFFHPTIVSDKVSHTVNFYEDHFEFVPTIEQDGYVFMQNKDRPEMCIAVVDVNHECIRNESVKPVQGLILNFPVADVNETFNALYFEGLDIQQEPKENKLGSRHFIVRDPNGVLICLAQAVAN